MCYRTLVLTHVCSVVLAVALVFSVVPASAGQNPFGRNPFSDTPETTAFRLFLRGPGAQIGVAARTVELSEASRQKVDGGAVIEEVSKDSPASRAGLKKGDIIIVFDGEAVRNAAQLLRAVRDTPPGWAVTAIIVRDGKRQEISVTPAPEILGIQR